MDRILPILPSLIPCTTLQADGSAGITVKNSSGTDVAVLGAGPGTTTTLAGDLACTTVTASDLLQVTRAANSASTEWGTKITLTQSGTGIGYAFEPSVIAAGAGASSSAASVYAKASTLSGSRDHIVALQGRSTHNSTGTLVDLLGAAIYTVKDVASGDITSIKGVEINTPTISGGTVTNAYGLWIGDQTGATNNYAIKTGLGRVDFGDAVYVPSGTGFYIGGFARVAGASTVTNFYSGSSTLNFYSQDRATLLGSIGNATGSLSMNGGITCAGPLVIGTDPGGSNTLRVGGAITIASATMITTTTSFTNGAAAAAGTLTNAPAAGNPTKWIPVNDNGTTRYIPAW